MEKKYTDMVKSVGCLLMLGLACLCNAAGASSYKVIYTFRGSPDGAGPASGLISDSQGRLYGTTLFGGQNGLGTVFRLTRPASGSGPWTEEILHSFADTDGSNPYAPVLLGPSGEVYGTADGGGTYGLGVVFRLDNTTGWPITILHAFGAAADGIVPQAGLAFGPGQLIYGSTPDGGTNDGGTAFSISPLGDSVEYAIIQQFGLGNAIGPSQLTVSPSGILYGVTQIGGVYDGAALQNGTAFSLQQTAGGAWSETTLHSFGAVGDAYTPGAPFLLGRNALAGSLVGCEEGGAHYQGAVLLLNPQRGGAAPAKETILYDFGAAPGDPIVNPPGGCGLTQDNSARLFGLSHSGGAYGAGTFFELDPPQAPNQSWTEKIIHNFTGKSQSGSSPYGAPLGIGGLYYGTAVATSLKGPPGVVWQIRP